MKISHKVPFAASAIVIFVFSVFSIVQYQMVHKGLYKNTESRINEATTILGHQITNWLNGKLALIDMMAERIDKDFSIDTIRQTMDGQLLKENFILVFGALETDGFPIGNDEDWNPGDNWDGRKRPWYSLANSERRAILTSPYADSATGDILISVVANFYDNGEIKGAFGGDLSLKTVSEALNVLNFNDTGYAFLIDGTGEIISHPNTGLNGWNLNSLFRDELPSLTPNLQEVEIDGKTILTAFRPLAELYGSNWSIGVVLEKDKVMSGAYTLGIYAAIGAFLSALISSLALYLIMRKLLLAPIDKLTTIADSISLGRLQSIIKEAERNDEIGIIARSLERMSDSLRIAFDRLKKK